MISFLRSCHPAGRVMWPEGKVAFVLVLTQFPHRAPPKSGHAPSARFMGLPPLPVLLLFYLCPCHQAKPAHDGFTSFIVSFLFLRPRLSYPFYFSGPVYVVWLDLFQTELSPTRYRRRQNSKEAEGGQVALIWSDERRFDYVLVLLSLQKHCFVHVCCLRT